eukprot:809374-Pyramimonas_sp.AAC.1
MRQCQSSAHGVDAARTTACFFKADSALWSNGAQRAVLEMVCNGGSLESIEYGRVFNEMGESRVELAVALFCKTYCESAACLCD